MKITDLVPGTKLELELYNEDGDTIKPVFVSEVEWVNDGNTAVIAAPIHEGIIIPVPVGAYMKVYFVNKSREPNKIEMYEFDAVVIGRRVIDNIAVLEIEQESKIVKIQRRQFFRFECVLPVKYRQVVSLNQEHNTGISFKKTYTRDISGGGLCIVTEEELEMNRILEIELTLSEDDIKTFYGTVVRVIKLEELEKNKYEIGVWFKKIDNKDREAIVRYIFAEQRKLIKKGLI